jgi:hypothetical protein
MNSASELRANFHLTQIEFPALLHRLGSLVLGLVGGVSDIVVSTKEIIKVTFKLMIQIKVNKQMFIFMV